jgi:isoleucyl-tRNA synthetase
MYQNLVRSVDGSSPESVHHTQWPRADPALDDPALTRDMALVLKLVSLGHAARNKSNRKVRQPLAEAAFAVGNSQERQAVERHADLIADELNVKKVRLLDAAGEVVDFRLNPFPKQLGQKYGSRFPRVREAILALDPARAAPTLLEGKPIRVTIGPESIEILPEEVEVRVDAHAGLSASAEAGYLAALSTELTPELELEGLAREFVRRVQELRKDAGFQVADRIHVRFAASPRLGQALEAFGEYAKAETLAVEMGRDESPKGEAASEHAFDGETLRVAITRAR